jgi:hypothetical protein
MMRMGLIVVGLSTLTIMELGTPTPKKNSVPDPFDQLTINVSVSADTLETADRLETHHLQHKVPLQTISPVEAPPQPPAVTDSIQEDSSTAGLSANEEKDVVKIPKPRPKYTEANKPGLKRTNSNKGPKTERSSKAMVEIKQCRTNALDSLLKALKLSSPRCQT